jgi:sugar porter (SP) family MFS transporter
MALTGNRNSNGAQGKYSMTGVRLAGRNYAVYIVAIAGLGGLLYGIDLGIIAAALPYLDSVIRLTVEQSSIIVAAVLGGSVISSIVGGLLADWLGRRKMIIASGLLFVASVAIILISHGFLLLFLGRLLQGLSCGIIGLVIPLYLAECLSPQNRGKGTAIFQFMLTLGIVLAAVVGWFYTGQAQTAISRAAGNVNLIRTAQNEAWRSMFLATIYPGLIFFVGSLYMIETPRWLFRKGRPADSMASLRQLSPPDEAELQMREMAAINSEDQQSRLRRSGGSLLRRKYIVPFVLACTILACNQATGINSILGFLVVILKQAGMSPRHATLGDVIVKVLNCLMTILAVVLVDRKGRRFLLKIGTGGAVLSLLGCAILFYFFESRRADVRVEVQQALHGNKLIQPFREMGLGQPTSEHPMSLTVLYSYGSGDKVATAVSSENDAVVNIVPDTKESTSPLVIKRALYGPVPTAETGWLVTICLGLFISFYSIGPGVVVWLTLSELMPTRIRSTGMGIALLLNAGVSTLIAALFLPVVGNYGFCAMFLFWAACTLIYFITATFFLPETKGKTLEEIEEYFENRSPAFTQVS